MTTYRRNVPLRVVGKRKPGRRENQRPVKSVAEERRCHCGAKLSSYNLGVECFAHTPVKFPRVRGRVT